MATQIKVIARNELETAEMAANHWLEYETGISGVKVDLKVYTTTEPGIDPVQWFTFVIQYEEKPKPGSSVNVSRPATKKIIFK